MGHPPDRDPQTDATASRCDRVGLLGAFEAARVAWPLVLLDIEHFRTHLAQLGYRGPARPRYPSDVYLGLGCSLGLRAARHVLEVAYLAQLREALRPLMLDEQRESVMQRVRDALLDGPRPLIGTYRGDVPLLGWLRTLVLSAARNERRLGRLDGNRYTRASTCRALAAEAGPDAALAPEAELSAQQSALVERCLLAALATLPAEERQFMHHHFVSGLGLDQLGCLYSVERTLAARRLRRNLACLARGVARELARLEPTTSGSDRATIASQLAARLQTTLAALRAQPGGVASR